MGNVEIVGRKPIGEELLSLRDSVGWSRRDAADIQKGLDGSLCARSIRAGASAAR